MPSDIIVRVLQTGPLSVNSVIIADAVSRACVIVDPAGSGPILRQLNRDGLTPVLIAVTHAHFDHCGGIADLVASLPSPKPIVAVPRDDLDLWNIMPQQTRMFGVPSFDLPEVDVLFPPNWDFSFGDHKITALHTPGHSPGSSSFVIDDNVLVCSGDTIFRSGVGRTDLWGGSLPTLTRSIANVLGRLPPKTRVIPGHGPETTIGDECC
jgi:glyoxylase-like metal-dependent hydrolase (beta-lactamase superfamily II)